MPGTAAAPQGIRFTQTATEHGFRRGRGSVSALSMLRTGQVYHFECGTLLDHGPTRGRIIDRVQQPARLQARDFPRPEDPAEEAAK
jgi:hypothetical protein